MNYADPGYFERLYQGDADPWGFTTSDYEREKYVATLAVLPRPRFGQGFEVGCSIGVLTRMLADYCDRLLGVDLSETALGQARIRCADLPHVTLERMAIPTLWPPGPVDLVVLSEVLYYLGTTGIKDAAVRTLDSLTPGGVVVLVNWRGETGGACTGDRAADLFMAEAMKRLVVVNQIVTKKYRIDVLAY